MTSRFRNTVIPMLMALLASVGATFGPFMTQAGQTFNRWQAHPLFKPVCAGLALVGAVLLDTPAFLAAPLMFGVMTEVARTGEFIITELPGTTSRDEVTVTVPANTTLSVGFVLAELTATGKYVPYDNVGADGSQIAAGILYATLINDTGAPVDMQGVVINAWAEVRLASLVWATGLVDADETAGLADLRARGIKARSPL